MIFFIQINQLRVYLLISASLCLAHCTPTPPTHDRNKSLLIFHICPHFNEKLQNDVGLHTDTVNVSDLRNWNAYMRQCREPGSQFRPKFITRCKMKTWSQFSQPDSARHFWLLPHCTEGHWLGSCRSLCLSLEGCIYVFLMLFIEALITLAHDQQSASIILSVCRCHGSSCGGCLQLNQAETSLLSLILIHCITAHFSIHFSTHFKAMTHRVIKAKKYISHVLHSEISLKHTITWQMTFIHDVLLPSFSILWSNTYIFCLSESVSQRFWILNTFTCLDCIPCTCI